jgi:hypothetical protein
MRRILSRIADHVDWPWLWERLPERWFDQADVVPGREFWDAMMTQAAEQTYQRQARACQRGARWIN